MKSTNERRCITVLFSKTSKPSETNDPQCKEDDTALAFGITKNNELSGRTRIRGYVG